MIVAAVLAGVLVVVLSLAAVRLRGERARAEAAEAENARLTAELLRLVTTAHPLVAAAAKAAALRLGVEVSKTGSLDEVAPFVAEDDLAVLGGWAEPPSSSR